MAYDTEFVPEIRRLFEGYEEARPTDIRMQAVFSRVRHYDRRDLSWAVNVLLGWSKMAFDLGKSLAEECEKAAGERRKVEVGKDRVQADQALQTVPPGNDPISQSWGLLHASFFWVPRKERVALVKAW